jgi:hypothetical protein
VEHVRIVLTRRYFYGDDALRASAQDEIHALARAFRPIQVRDQLAARACAPLFLVSGQRPADEPLLSAGKPPADTEQDGARPRAGKEGFCLFSCVTDKITQGTAPARTRPTQQ